MKNKIPKHVAMIADGNHRWAVKNSVSKLEGYKAGILALENIAIKANELGVQYVTFFVLSSENIKMRSAEWLKAFWSLANEKVKEYLKEDTLKNLRVNTIGDWELLPASLQKNLNLLKKKNQNNTGTVVTLAIAYSGKNEIIQAINRILEKETNITSEIFEHYLYTSGIPDPELMIRTSGVKRLSGFLPWQLSYTELLFIDELWPDFSPELFEAAISYYQGITRNFGKEGVYAKQN